MRLGFRKLVLNVPRLILQVLYKCSAGVVCAASVSMVLNIPCLAVQVLCIVLGLWVLNESGGSSDHGEEKKGLLGR